MSSMHAQKHCMGVRRNARYVPPKLQFCEESSSELVQYSTVFSRLAYLGLSHNRVSFRVG